MKRFSLAIVALVACLIVADAAQACCRRHPVKNLIAKLRCR